MRHFVLSFLIIALAGLTMAARDTKAEVYHFFYSWLPSMAAVITPADAPEVLGDPHSQQRKYESHGLSPAVSADDITVDKFGEGDKAVYVWTFPMPADIPNPLYMAFVPYNGHYKTVQLEKSMNGFWVLGCNVKAGNHSNYGTVDFPSGVAEFFNILWSKGLIGHEVEPEATFEATDEGSVVTTRR